MPKDFLESFPLYKKFYYDFINQSLGLVPKPPIKMYCDICKSNQTFNNTMDYFKLYKRPEDYRANGEVIGLEYICMSCKKFKRYFFIEISEDLNWIRKIGQVPPWDISVDKEIGDLLGKERLEIYQKGLINESQSYGIGAFAYYRRIVEGVIDELLKEISVMIDEKNLVEYNEALKKLKDSHNGEEKIKAVYDLLPLRLIPNGNNPLKILYKVLSEGIHSDSDEECLENAQTIRHILIFLITEVKNHQIGAKQFTAGLKRLGEKNKD
ncbi:hypothetical protein [Methanobacterium spitsbergense]|uniref:Uncharacterized protein n=1 Tax=Methanobacterium spitsbergense TaxID=2874285 RepID=A0A8T5UY53_9EURY|nr:hypothetical protein [Methanobacterium spitsbergense]MBZ2164501.1 hypothetical protein [Methanobacterium spitsbergense]